MICVSNTLLEFVRELHLLSHEARPFILIQRRGYVACEGYSKLTLYLSPPPLPIRIDPQYNIMSPPSQLQSHLAHVIELTLLHVYGGRPLNKVFQLITSLTQLHVC